MTQPKSRLKLNDLDLDSTYIEEISNAEAATISGGANTTADLMSGSDASGADFSAQLGELQAMFHEAQARNIMMRKLTTEEGTELKAAGKDVNPK